MFQLMTVSPKIGSPSEAPPLQVQATTADITFDNVSFEYLPGQPILRNLSFHVPAGQSVAIVGGEAGQYSLKRRLSECPRRFHNHGEVPY